MSDKALFVMDMPESCMGCNFLYCDIENNTESCQAEETARAVDLEKGNKPDWCPLKPMPEKKECDLLSVGSKIRIWREGWNACIDKILGEEKMTRLTSRDEHGHAYFPQCFEDPCNGCGCQKEPCEFMMQVCEKLAQYEEEERKEHENKDMAEI